MRQNLIGYITEFSADARDVFERFKFIDRIVELDDKDLLFKLVQMFATVEEQFAMGDFKEAFAEIVIEAQDAHNHIAEQLLKDERIFGVMQRMVAKMVWQGFQSRPMP